MHIAGRNDPLVKVAGQQLTMNAVRQTLNLTTDAVPWNDKGRKYQTKEGYSWIEVIHDGDHKYPAFAPDLEFLNKMYDDQLIERLKQVIASKFERLTYTQAVEILMASGQAWEFPVSWGTDLQSEHERYLVEKHFGRPVILTDYPKDIKAFYMKQNADGRTVRGMDVLFPKIGEIIGGSQREENLEALQRRIREMNIPEKDVWWYLDTRKFGTAPHAGFGLGFERLILFVTGMANIRDVIPFPRTPKNAEF